MDSVQNYIQKTMLAHYDEAKWEYTFNPAGVRPAKANKTIANAFYSSTL